MSTRPRIGVILSSGGVRGVYAHTGFMRALQEMGIHFDAIAGCSAGAIVGGIMASGTSLDNWTQSLDKMTQQDFWQPDSILKFLHSHLLDKGRGYMGLSSTDPALNFTINNLSVKTFEECKVPFYSLAISLSDGEKTVFSSGELAPRIVASAAVPILYEPVLIEGDLYCDGALIDFAPTDAICCKHNLDVVLVHHVSQNNAATGDINKLKQQPWALLEIANRLLFRARPWYLNNQPLNIQHCPCDCGASIVAVEPDLPELRWPSIDGADQVLAAAHKQAIEQLHSYSDVFKSGTGNKLRSFINTISANLHASHEGYLER
ncbi:MAG: patatin-like phospholipase family protein [Gammaproteobacteria bacterium]